MQVDQFINLKKNDNMKRKDSSDDRRRTFLEVSQKNLCEVDDLKNTGSFERFSLYESQTGTSMQQAGYQNMISPKR